ncbi:hypothetical protein ACTFRN_09470 [Bacillus cereus group sp. MYBK245-2]|uniref:Uncharacterized protein n=1 Tax=Bacillus pacificus TaxID=2026187 RepID=A0A1Y5ZHW6_9BACI|nr:MULTISPECIES: hypothetical protein [Bacillus cereus group]MDA1507905.1 hypothetical protein [Bacillus cereus group sp. TH36-2LC]ONG85831.1 hypothetical protein BKK40_27820 [Bacillus cereus]MDA1576286.1 hypothetical protein [Bacillus cereus group sp. TH242-3LC]MDA1828940.1 hypothetical protein [Bacillus cereus group sp. BY25LC]MDA1895092.1 hypothetical protein [Bacillus cereus group sp. BcHK28]
MSFTLKIEKAFLNKRGSERLTYEKLEKIKWLLNSTRFDELYDIELQWEHMLEMMNYKKVLMNQFQSKIEMQLSQWGSIPQMMIFQGYKIR